MHPAAASLLSLADPGELEHRFEHCLILIDPDARRVTTRFEDGAELVACPNLEEESADRARSLPYRANEAAVWATTRDHERLHTVMAEAQGHRWSATLGAVAHEYRLAPGVVEQEEHLALFDLQLQNVGLEHSGRDSDDDPDLESAISGPASTKES